MQISNYDLLYQSAYNTKYLDQNIVNSATSQNVSSCYKFNYTNYYAGSAKYQNYFNLYCPIDFIVSASSPVVLTLPQTSRNPNILYQQYP